MLDACRVFSTLRILQDFVGCENFLSLEDKRVLLDCSSLDFVEELDFMAGEQSDSDIALLPFSTYDSIFMGE